MDNYTADTAGADEPSGSADPTAQVLVLLPEIALTQAALDRIEARFGARPAEWHSAVPPPKRRHPKAKPLA